MVQSASMSKVRRSRTRLRCAVAALLLALLASVVGQVVGGPVTAAAAAGPPYYLALGDSLAQGVQPNSTAPLHETNRGYVDDLYAIERTRIPGLRLAKLGCPGETTTTMRTGGVCSYALGSQLAQAMAFVATHRVAFITIDIGANNIDGCVSTTGISTTCIAGGLSAAATDLPVILGTLRTAAPRVPIYAMNYYDPFLAEWLTGASGQVLARESVCLTTGFGYPTYCPLATGFNGLLDSVYGAFAVPVANVAAAFQTNNFSTLPFLGVPVNVALICAWTWMCAPPPLGPNIHANDVGYAVIAGTFARKIGGL
jgi:lysophospholipase L1-like esterase